MKPRPYAVVTFAAAGLLACAPWVSHAQAKDKPKRANAPQASHPTKETPRVAVATNVQVNIATWLQLGPAAAKPPAPPERKTETAKESGVADLLPALQKASQSGPPVVVLTNVKVDIATWLNIAFSPSDSPSDAKPTKSAPSKNEPTKSVQADAAKTNGAAANTAKAGAVKASTTNTNAEKKPGATAVGRESVGASAGDPADDLFELHVRVRRTAGGFNVLLAGTTPSAQGAALTAEIINQLRDQGLLGLAIVPLILKTDPKTHRMLRDALGSVKAEARGPHLSLSASIPKEAVNAAAEATQAAVKFVKGLVGRQE